MNAYEFFGHTTDIGARVHGATLPELFADTAHALRAAMGTQATTAEVRQRSIELRAASLADSLHDWLMELLFEAETHQVRYNFRVEQLPGSTWQATVIFDV